MSNVFNQLLIYESVGVLKPIQNGDELRLYNSLGNKHVGVKHDGSNGVLFNDVGNLHLDTASELLFDSATGQYALRNNVAGTSLMFVLSNTYQQAVLSLRDQVGRQLIVTDHSYASSDFNHSVRGNPTLYIHANVDPAVNSEANIHFEHNSVDGKVNTGDGYLRLLGADGAMVEHHEGDILSAFSNAETDAGGKFASYTKAKEIMVPRDGKLRIKFDLRTLSSTGYGRIYVNGVAQGTERTTSSSSYTTFSEDITVEAGDNVQIYLKSATTANFTYVGNFRIYESCGSTFINNLD